MSLRKRVAHRFVQHIPDKLDDGVVYVSIEFATAAHKCVCGCGREVVTPLSPTDWELRYDGESISLYPSIGNWGYPCRSHYWITKNNVRSARKWSDDEIEEGRQADALNKAVYFEGRQLDEREVADGPEASAPTMDDPEDRGRGDE